MAQLKQEDVIEDSLGSDTWLLNSVEMEKDEEIKSLEVKTENEENVREVKMEIKQEGEEEEYGSDAWLKDSVKMEEEEFKMEISSIEKIEFTENNVEEEQNVESSDGIAVTNEVGNMCRYKCQKCDKIYENKASLYGHLKVKAHYSKSSGNYGKRKNSYLVKIVMHECKICLEKIRCEKGLIRSHLKNVHHGKTMEEYRDIPRTDPKRLLKRENMVSRKGMVMRKWKEATKDATFSESIGNLCKYKCKVCNKISESRAAFRGHLERTKHSQTSGMDLNSFLIQTVLHKCKICSKEIFCDRCEIMQHIKSHNIKSLREYIEMTGVKCSGTYLESGPKEKIAQFCQTNANSDNITSNVGNLCIYECDKCDDYTCKTWGTMPSHALKMKHGQLMSPTMYITKATFHKCVLCGKIMLCDLLFVARHLKSHKLNVKEYVQGNKLTALGDTWEKYSIELNEKIRDIQTIMVDSHSDELVTNEIGNMCKYQCQNCDKIFESKTKLYFHFKGTGHHGKSSGRKRNTYLINAVMHECKICLKKIRCENKFIRLHLRNVHQGKTLEEYRNMPKTDPKKLKGNEKVVSRKGMVERKWKEATKDATFSESIGNLCKYKCKVCNKISESRTAFRGHLERTKHSQTSGMDLNSFLIQTVVHKCKICSKEIFCDRCEIMQHIKSHNIKSLWDYMEMTGVKYSGKEEPNVESRKSMLEKKWEEATKDAMYSEAIGNLCRYKCKVCNNILQTKMSFITHLKRTKHAVTSDINLSDFLIRTVLHKCKICSKLVFCERGIILQHVKLHNINNIKEYMEMTGAKYTYVGSSPKDILAQFCQNRATKDNTISNVGNLCVYECDKCDGYTCKTWGTMTVHALKMKHGAIMSPTKYMTSVVFHKCVVCEKVMPCDRLFIARHVKWHKLGMEEYVKKYKLTVLGDTKENKFADLKDVIKDIAPVQAQPHWIMKSNLLTNNQVTSNVGNISFFKCLLCSKDKFCFGTLKGHYKRCHKVNNLPYNIENVVEARYHKCFVCSKILICDNYFLTKHVYKHKLSYVQYCQSFVLKNGGRVIQSAQK